MRKKLMTAVTVTAALSLALSIAAVIICSNARPAPSAAHTKNPPAASRTGDSTTLPPSAPSDTASKTAGIYGDDVYLLIYRNGTLLALDAGGDTVDSCALDAAILTESELKMLSDGIMIAGRDELRCAFDDLVR